MSKDTSVPQYPETAVYAGRRIGSKGKTLHCFVKPDGTEMYFTGIKKVWMGNTYRCGVGNISTRPERVDDVERVDNPDWEAKDALVDELHARKRAEKKIAGKSKPAIKAAIAALKPLCVGLDSFDARRLIEYLMQEALKR